MGLRRTLAQILSAPTALLLDAAMRDLVDEILDAHDYVRTSELVGLHERVEALRRDLASRRSDIDALRQSLAAMAGGFDDDLDEMLGLDDASLQALVSRADDVGRKLDRTNGAAAATRAQLDELTGRVEAVAARAHQAKQIATSAMATAEAAIDGITDLEAGQGRP